MSRADKFLEDNASVADLGKVPDGPLKKDKKKDKKDKKSDMSLAESVSHLLDVILDDTCERKIRKVVRKGKVVRKLVCPPGKKAQGGKCVRMSPAEKRARKIAQKRGARKRKARSNISNKKRQRSNRRRKSSIG